MRTHRTPSILVSARVFKTYGGISGVTHRNLSTFAGIGGCAVMSLLSIKAEGFQSFDLRIEIDPSIYSAQLCQELVALHKERDVSPWGMVFARPSHLCSFPGAISKAYSVNMWRLVLNELENSIRMTLCRPVKRRGILIEDCPWFIGFEKGRNWRDALKDKEFIFFLVAGLHEKLPIRDFTRTGFSGARAEPRFESERLQTPPKLVPGKLELKEDSGRLLFTPVQTLGPSVSPSPLWWMQAGDRNERLAAFIVAADNAGYTMVSRARPPKPKAYRRTPPPLAAPPPGPLGPIESTELSEVGTAASLQQIATQDSSDPWINWWGGVWHTRITLAGIPASRASLSRVPALAAFGVESRHSLYRSFSTGVLARYEIDREAGELLVNTSLNRETQIAMGKRATLSLGSTNAVDGPCGEGHCLVGLNLGYRSVSSQWTYDAEKTTLKVWTPQGGGLFLEPWFQWSALRATQPSGFIAEVRYTDHLFSDAQARILSLEGAWHWGEDWATADLGLLRIKGLQTGAGLRIGNLEKTGFVGTNETGTALNLMGFWFSIKTNVEEVVDRGT